MSPDDAPGRGEAMPDATAEHDLGDRPVGELLKLLSQQTTALLRMEMVLVTPEIDDAGGELGDTAAALAAKTDVKARTREKVDDVKRAVSDKARAMASKAPADGEELSSQASSAAAQLKAKLRENPQAATVAAGF